MFATASATAPLAVATACTRCGEAASEWPVAVTPLASISPTDSSGIDCEVDAPYGHCVAKSTYTDQTKTFEFLAKVRVVAGAYVTYCFDHPEKRRSRHSRRTTPMALLAICAPLAGVAEEKQQALHVHSVMAPEFALEFGRAQTALFNSGDPVLRALGQRMKAVRDFYEVSLTVVGCVGRMFAEGLAGWLLVQHLPQQVPSMDGIRGYDDNGDLRLMLGARVRRLGGILPAAARADFKVLSRLGNLECHDTDAEHGLQDGQQQDVADAMLRLVRLTVTLAGSLHPCPEPVQRLYSTRQARIPRAEQGEGPRTNRGIRDWSSDCCEYISALVLSAAAAGADCNCPYPLPLLL
jgi:hypothetical protein